MSKRLEGVGTVIGLALKAVVPPGTLPRIEARQDAHEARLQALEQREAARETKPSIKFCGVWKGDRHYEPGDGVTHAGGLWICQRHQPGPPAQDFVGWTLAVKRGAVAK